MLGRPLADGINGCSTSCLLRQVGASVWGNPVEQGINGCSTSCLLRRPPWFMVLCTPYWRINGCSTFCLLRLPLGSVTGVLGDGINGCSTPYLLRHEAAAVAGIGTVVDQQLLNTLKLRQLIEDARSTTTQRSIC